jgi:hypothetical protein
MASDLTTTNVLLGIMAAVSLLEAAGVIGVLLGAFLIYLRVMRAVASIEDRQVGPAIARVNAILDDVKDVTSTVRQEAGRVDQLVDWLLEAIGHRRRHIHQASSTRVM